jgi:hypothetical protein
MPTNDSEVFGGRPVLEFEHDRDRRSFLRWALVIGAGGSLAGSGILAAAQGGGGDIGILNYALTLEYLERDFFDRGLKVLSGRNRDLVAPIAAHEREHVSIISSTIADLGGSPVNKPGLRYPAGIFRDEAAWLETAAQLESVAVGAYHGQVTRIQNPDLLTAAASIAGTESRHAAILAEISGGNPFPAPLEEPSSKKKVLAAARPFLRG